MQRRQRSSIYSSQLPSDGWQRFCSAGKPVRRGLLGCRGSFATTLGPAGAATSRTVATVQERTRGLRAALMVASSPLARSVAAVAQLAITGAFYYRST